MKDDDPQAWAKAQLESQVNYLYKNRMIDGRVQVAHAWSRPGQVCIGKITAAQRANRAFWCISGSVPTDAVELSVAPDARSAARHFALKWQMEVARLESSESVIGADDSDVKSAGSELVRKAEALYTLTQDDANWN